MSIYVLEWIKEDLAKEGKDLKDFKLIDIKNRLKEYKKYK